MIRWKQVLRCNACNRRRWREVEVHPADSAPDLQALLRRAVCAGCGSRALTAQQYEIGPRHGDQTLPGGLRLGLITFATCERRDAEVRQALAEYRARWGEDYVHASDPEFGGE